MSNRAKSYWGINPNPRSSDFTKPRRRPRGQVKPVISTKKHGKKMDVLSRNNCERAAGFGRFIRIAALVLAILAIGKCAFGQVSFTSNFQIRLNGDTAAVSHTLVDVKIGNDVLSITERSGAKRIIITQVEGIEIRETGPLFILQDGIAHYVKDKTGQFVVWTGSAGQWLFYDYIPLKMQVVNKHEQ